MKEASKIYAGGSSEQSSSQNKADKELLASDDGAMHYISLVAQSARANRTIATITLFMKRRDLQARRKKQSTLSNARCRLRQSYDPHPHTQCKPPEQWSNPKPS